MPTSSAYRFGAPLVAADREGAMAGTPPASRWSFDRSDATTLFADPVESDPGPYEHYSRVLTPKGGVLITYKDLDLRFRQYAWRALAWLAFTGAEAWYLWAHTPLRSGWLNALCLVLVAVANWLVVRKPSECIRRLEVRNDCLILEGSEVFWRSQMEAGPPEMRPDEQGNLVLGGIYGTRFVEFAILRRFDELDRAPEVFKANIDEALAQLWLV